MKEKLKKLIKKPILIVLIIISVLYLPKGLAAPPEGLERVHAITIAVDITEDGQYDVGILAFVSFQSQQYRETYFIINATADSLANAVDKLGALAGKKIALTHTSALVFSDKIAEMGLIEPLDYFFRDKNLGGDTHLIVTYGNAKDIIKLEQNAIDKVGIKLEELSVFNDKYVYYQETNLESFYSGYFSPVKTSIISIVKQNPEALAQLEQSSGSSSGTGVSSGQQKNFVQPESNLAVFYDGKMVTVLSGSEIRGSTWVNPELSSVNLKIDNVFDENLNFIDASIIFNVETNLVETKAYFERGRPIIEYNLLLGLKLDEVLQENIEEKNFYVDVNFLSETVKLKIENKVKQEFASAMKKMIENKADVIGIYSIFAEQQHAKFLNWYENLENPEEFLGRIEYCMTVLPVIAY